MELIRDLGMKFPASTSKQKKRFGLYTCPKCDEKFEASTPNVNSGYTKSCGCDRDHHGGTGTKLYFVYRGMLNRCYVPSVGRYDRYGGRGITVCDEWKSKFSVFKAWANENGYENGLSIDRIDNNDNYSPENCEWVRRSTQATNTVLLPKNNTTGHRGVYHDNGRYRVIISTNGMRVAVGNYDTVELASEARDNYIVEHGLINMQNATLGISEKDDSSLCMEIEYNSIVKPLYKIARDNMINAYSLRDRINSGMSIIDAIETPFPVVKSGKGKIGGSGEKYVSMAGNEFRFKFKGHNGKRRATITEAIQDKKEYFENTSK